MVNLQLPVSSSKLRNQNTQCYCCRHLVLTLFATTTTTGTEHRSVHAGGCWTFSLSLPLFLLLRRRLWSLPDCLFISLSTHPLFIHVQIRCWSFSLFASPSPSLSPFSSSSFPFLLLLFSVVTLYIATLHLNSIFIICFSSFILHRLIKAILLI